MCAGVAAQKKLHELGMHAQPLMNLEEILKVDPSGELHEEPLTNPPWVMDPSGSFATDNLTGANLDPKMVAEARK